MTIQDQRKCWAAIAGTAALGAALAACSGGGPAPAPPPAMPAAYTRAVSAMTAYCTQDAAGIGGMVTATHQVEVQDGIKDETVTQLAQNLEKAVSANGKPSPACASEFAAYVALRAGGS